MYINFIKKGGNFKEFEKLWLADGNGDYLFKSHKRDILEDVTDLSELIGFFLLTKYNDTGKFENLDKVIESFCSDVRNQFDKKYNKLYAKIKLLYKSNFIPKHIDWRIQSKKFQN
jgi:hypothetical protein